MTRPADRLVVAGVGVEPFVARSPDPAGTLGRRALRRALGDAGLELPDVGWWVFAARFEHPALGQRVLAPLGPSGATIVNTENACASASIGFALACAAVQAGFTDVAAVVGVERASALGATVPLPDWDRLGRAGVTHPARYALEAARYCAETGCPPEALAAVAVKNRRHAAANPVARFRAPVTLDDVVGSPPVADPLTRLQCCANADGAAAVIVTTAGRAAPGSEPVDVLAVATGSGVRSDRPPARPLTARLAAEAWERAGAGPGDVDVAEVYDAFTVLEVLATEDLGFTPPGTAAARIARGAFALGGDGLVTNPGGGLLGRGHPLGATGAAQLAEVVEQLRGRAGARQVPGARLGAVHTLGGNVRELEANAAAVVVLGR